MVLCTLGMQGGKKKTGLITFALGQVHWPCGKVKLALE